MRQRDALVLLLVSHLAVRLASAEAPAAPTDEELKQVAAEYYAQVAQHKADEEKAYERGKQVRSGETLQLPDTATGCLTDRSGKPIPGVTVLISLERKREEVLGQGRTDEQGRFSIPLGGTRYEGLRLSADPEGYGLNAGSFDGGIVDARVWCERTAGNLGLAQLAREPNALKRLWGVLEVIGVRHSDGPEGILPDVFAQIGAIRADLLAIIKSGHFKAADEHEVSPEKRALELLAWWRDPEDQALFPEEPRPLPKVLPADDIDRALQSYADAHFNDAPEEKRTMHGFGKPVLGADGRRALVAFTVEYANWGFSRRILLMKEDNGWVLRRSVNHMRWHKMSPGNPLPR